MPETHSECAPEIEMLQVVTACADVETATRLAHGAVAARLAACVQITAPVTSIYHWQGRVEQAAEVLCVFKTLSSLYAALEDFIRLQHPYEIPEIIAQPILRVSQDYQHWLRSELNRPPAS